MRRPGTVTASFVLWLITAIIHFALAILVLTGALGVSLAAGSALGAVLAIVGLIIALIAFGVVFAMKNGANWARILLTIIAVLIVIGAINNSAQGESYGLFTLVAAIVATILMYVGGANAYFRRR